VIWGRLRRLLRSLSLHPALPAFSRIPVKVIDSIGFPLDAERFASGEPQLLTAHQRLLTNHFRFPCVSESLKRLLGLADNAMDLSQTGSVRTFSRDVMAVLSAYWRKRPLVPFSTAPDKPPATEPITADGYAKAVPDDAHVWLRLAEDYFALQAV